jgi:sulfur transfer protein SufE
VQEQVAKLEKSPVAGCALRVWLVRDLTPEDVKVSVASLKEAVAAGTYANGYLQQLAEALK